MCVFCKYMKEDKGKRRISLSVPSSIDWREQTVWFPPNQVNFQPELGLVFTSDCIMLTQTKTDALFLNTQTNESLELDQHILNKHTA